MDKYIKNKKKIKLKDKQIFSKRDILFMKKFPNLFSLCSANNISYDKVSRDWNKVKRKMRKEEFQNAYHIVLFLKIVNYLPSKNSQGKYYQDFFKKVGINI